jgi:hypothetical protein
MLAEILRRGLCIEFRVIENLNTAKIFDASCGLCFMVPGEHLFQDRHLLSNSQLHQHRRIGFVSSS